MVMPGQHTLTADIRKKCLKNQRLYSPSYSLGRSAE
jgi:hypothetical protein